MLWLIIVVPYTTLSLIILFLVFQKGFLGAKNIVPAVNSGTKISVVVGVMPVVMLT